MTDINQVITRLKVAEDRLKEIAQGRVYYVGTKVVYNERFGVVTHLHQGEEDPTASTVDLRMEDGSIYLGVKVSSDNLSKFRS
jgi:hypothetical protein